MSSRYLPPGSTIPIASALLDWLDRLIEASTPLDTAQMIVELARARGLGERATVVWDLHRDGPYRCVPERALGEHELDCARAAAETPEPPWVAPDGQHALRLFDASRVQSGLAVLLFEQLPGAADDDALLAVLRHAGRHLRRALELTAVTRSHQQLERSELLQRALFAISELAGAELEMSEMLRRIHGIVSTLMYAENFFIARYDALSEQVRFLHYADVEDPLGPQINLEVPLQSLQHSTTWHVLTGGRTLMGSSEQLRKQVHGPLQILGPDSRDWLGVPMIQDGVVAGVLVVQSYREGVGYSDDDRALLEFVGTHILTALERRQGKDELEEKVRLRTIELAELNRDLQRLAEERLRAAHLQAALFQIAQLATADIDESAFYHRVHSVVGELLNAENFFIALLSDEQDQLEFPYYVDHGMSRRNRRPLRRGLSEYVLRHGRPLLGLRPEIEQLAASGEVDLESSGNPAHCWLGVPLRVADSVIGLVVVQSYSATVLYGTADQELLSFVASQIANSIYRRRSTASLQQANTELELRVEQRTHELRAQILQRELIQRQLQHQVMHDTLTGLPNRGFLRERLEHVLAELIEQPERRCALLYLDVDRFKVINDSLGHLAGDEVLQQVAARLRAGAHGPSVVARLSGDEFAILLEDLADCGDPLTVAQALLDGINAPLSIAGKELQPTASMGIAIGDGSYHHADALLRDADIALYRAKQMGRKRYELFDETLAKHAIDELTMEAELQQALREDQFLPYFQPIFRLGSPEIVGYEALLRWDHPVRGILGPASLLKVAQDSGRIEAIDWRLFELACTQFARSAQRADFLTINVSALHLRHADFDQRLVQLLERCGLATNRLVVEVTEGSLLDDPDMVRATLGRLREVGVGAALDDFGTGYSSLSYLHSLPLRMLKIDRAFVHALAEGVHNNSSTVVAAILALSRALNIEVIAEGIETPAQRKLLARMGCELGQGFLLGTPAPGSYWFERAAEMC